MGTDPSAVNWKQAVSTSTLNSLICRRQFVEPPIARNIRTGASIGSPGEEQQFVLTARGRRAHDCAGASRARLGGLATGEGVTRFYRVNPVYEQSRDELSITAQGGARPNWIIHHV
jgi:hypothetical protein